MAHIVIMGAGLGGMPAAYEMRDTLPKEHKVTVVNAVDYFQFVPSNPWLAVGWRKREEVILQVAPLLERKGIAFVAKAVTQIDADAQQARARRRRHARLRLPRHHHRPQAQLRRSARCPGRRRRTHPFGVHGRPRRGLLGAVPGVREEPGPGRHRCDADGELLRPGLRVRLHPRHRPAPAQDPQQGADHLRHQRALHRPPGPGWRGRQQVDARVRDARPRHQVDHQRQDHQGRGRQAVRDPARRPGQRAQGARGAVQDGDDAAGVQGRATPWPRCPTCATRAASC